ncbi:pyrophosphatase [Rhodococcus erythropolis]|uniref:pyrophosphatase n=1 Tax=Rhodococcus erythropolis TaxID=1833 RepID=UPI001C9A741F|nr:pyrophosphatase [Rhodococcus erythropolis]MBY6385424.1 pyrophosphatase [Rhodococcus erythropolis]
MNIEALQCEVEKVSALYAERHGISRTNDWLMLKLGEEVGELTQAYLAKTGQTRDRGRDPVDIEDDFCAELSDVLAHVLLIATRFNIDLQAEVDRKWLVWNTST